jgi:UDP-N-acetyl-D-glucosamine dehydrogenase
MNNYSEPNNFLKRVISKDIVVGIFGLGYVGIPLAMSISRCGMKVIGFDVLQERVDQLNGNKSPIKHITDSDISKLNDSGFFGTTNFSYAAQCDALIICVPTPLNKYREPDLRFVVATMESIGPYLRKDQLLSLESTTWPGTTREVLLPYVEQAKLIVGENFYLAYSPEREDPGNLNYSTQTIPKVAGGHTPACLDAAITFYGSFIDTIVPVSSTDASEMVKLLENIHRSVNIGLVNEMKIVADKMGLDIFEIIDAAKSKPFGFTAYYPGPGIGGHCIPIDPFYLTWKAREHGLHTRFIELAGEINAGMPQYVVDKIIKALNNSGKSLNGANALVLGIAYKRDVDDMRESPSVFIMELLRDWGAHVAYSDPNVPIFPCMREHNFDLSSINLCPETLSKFDVVILLTDHSEFDYDMIKNNSKILVDTRGKFRGDQSIIRA